MLVSCDWLEKIQTVRLKMETILTDIRQITYVFYIIHDIVSVFSCQIDSRLAEKIDQTQKLSLQMAS